MDEGPRRALELVAACTVMLVVALGLAGCTAGPERVSGSPRARIERTASEPGVLPRAEVGFIELDAMAYELQGEPLTASATRLFYDFQPLDGAAETAPLLLLSAGGPGAAAMYLLAGGVGPYTGVAGSAARVAPNPSRFTSFAHVLAIDSRNAGFSYETTTDPSSQAERRSRFVARDYNAYVDAADSVRALLAFLQEHPALVRCPVYWLAESYGGLRATVALNMLLYHEAYARGGRAFHAAAVDEAVERFALQRLGSRSGSPERMSGELYGQVLIQPLLGGLRQAEAAGALFEQPGSVIERLAAEAGVDYTRCADQPAPCSAYDNARALLQRIGRSGYDYRRTLDWEQQERNGIDGAATHRDTLGLALGVALDALDLLFAERAAGAFRFADLTHSLFQPRGDLEPHWGQLEPWDAYFVSTNSEVMAAFAGQETAALEADPSYSGFAELLFENLRTTRALITRAEFDLTLYSPALVPLFESYAEVARAEVRAGSWAEQIEIELRDGTTETVVSPRYPESGHSVYRDEPTQLHEDVERFVEGR